MAVVVSKDGFITKGDNPNPSLWSSTEDQNNYQKLLKQFSVYIIGRETYQTSKYTLPKNKTKIILASSNQLHDIPGVVYENGPVQDIVDRLSKTYKTALLLGGANTYMQFLNQNLVNKAFVTLEPIMLRNGISLFKKSGSPLDYFRELMGTETSVTRLNDSGTLLYEFNRN